VLNSDYFSAFETTPTASNAVKIYKYVNNRTTVPEQPVVTFANMPTTASNTYRVWEGTDIIVYSEGATYIYQKLADIDDQEVAVSDSYKFNVGTTGGTYTFYGHNSNGNSELLTVTFEIKPKTKYTLIKSVDQLKEGHTYVLATPRMSYTTVEGKTTYTGKTMKNVTGNDRVATDVVFDEENPDVLYIDSNDVLLWNFVKQNADNPNAVPGYDWAIKAVNYVDGVYYLEESSSGSSAYLNMKSEPVYHSITINAKTNNAAITSNIDNNYQILYRSTANYSSFRSFSKNNEENDAYGAVRIYGTEEYKFDDLVNQYNEGETYTVNNLGVIFRHDKDLWVANYPAEDQNYTVHLIAKDNVNLPADIATTHYLNDCEISSITHLGGNYYQAYLTAKPTLDAEKFAPEWLNWDEKSEPITKNHYGHGAILYGTITENGNFVGEDNKVYYLNANDNANNKYNVKKYFNKTAQENSTEIKAPKRYDTASEDLSWAAYNGDWDWLQENVYTDSPDAQDAPKVYLGGMIDVVDGKVFVYPVTISTNRDIVVSVDTVTDDEHAYLVGRDIYLPEGAVLYTISGVRIAAENVADGIYVVKYANGTADKILVK
jgi:hypothetical protein